MSVDLVSKISFMHALLFKLYGKLNVKNNISSKLKSKTNVNLILDIIYNRFFIIKSKNSFSLMGNLITSTLEV